MSDDLYQTALLRLASEATGHGRLAAPQASITMDNPLCGDRITLDITLLDGRVSAVGHDVKACVLCQASASLIGRYAPGLNRDDLKVASNLISDLLHHPINARLPEGWDRAEALRPAAKIKSRHACVLLPFRALDDALKSVEAT